MQGFSGTTSFFRNGLILAITLIPSDDEDEFCVGVTFSSSSAVRSGYIERSEIYGITLYRFAYNEVCETDLNEHF